MKWAQHRKFCTTETWIQDNISVYLVLTIIICLIDATKIFTVERTLSNFINLQYRNLFLIKNSCVYRRKNYYWKLLKNWHLLQSFLSWGQKDLWLDSRGKWSKLKIKNFFIEYCKKKEIIFAITKKEIQCIFQIVLGLLKKDWNLIEQPNSYFLCVA